jgi:flagellar motor component MotA
MPNGLKMKMVIGILMAMALITTITGKMGDYILVASWMKMEMMVMAIHA